MEPFLTLLFAGGLLVIVWAARFFQSIRIAVRHDPLFTLTQHEFHQPTERNEWRTLSAGIEELTLNAGADRRTVLQRYAPGAETHMVHTHSYYEEVYLLEGTLTDRTLGEEWQRGAYAYRRPHMPHGPYTSRTGCTMFVTCSGEGA